MEQKNEDQFTLRPEDLLRYQRIARGFLSIWNQLVNFDSDGQAQAVINEHLDEWNAKAVGLLPLGELHEPSNSDIPPNLRRLVEEVYEGFSSLSKESRSSPERVLSMNGVRPEMAEDAGPDQLSFPAFFSSVGWVEAAENGASGSPRVPVDFEPEKDLEDDDDEIKRLERELNERSALIQSRKEKIARLRVDLEKETRNRKKMEKALKKCQLKRKLCESDKSLNALESEEKKLAAMLLQLGSPVNGGEGAHEGPLSSANNGSKY